MITAGQVLSFVLGFLTMVLSLWIYEKKFKKKRVFEHIGPDKKSKVRIAAEIHSYTITDDGTRMHIVIRDEDGSRSLFACTVPDDLQKRFPPGVRYFFTLEMEE